MRVISQLNQFCRTKQKENVKYIPNNFNQHDYMTLNYLIIFGQSRQSVVKYVLYFDC